MRLKVHLPPPPAQPWPAVVEQPRPGGGTAAPAVLLTATLRWPIAARLAMAFTDLGCRVEALCPSGHPVTHTRAARRIHAHSTLMPLLALRHAIASAAPDLIVPCDDDAAILLQRLHELSDTSSADGCRVRELIARSLGAPLACGLATTRGQLLALAAETGVRIPQTTVVATAEELREWIAAHRLPAVIKIDCTWGGQGVAIVRSHEEARRMFDRMAARPPIANALLRLLLDRDTSALANALREARRSVTVQDFIAGIPANRAIACWRGEVLAGTSVEAIRTQHPTGPATVVRVVDNAQMSDAARRLARRLGLSGLWGLDFMIEASTGAAYLIEMNPRATPICHLPLGAAHDLPAALCEAITGVAPAVCREPIEQGLIALFPGEWHRNPGSRYLGCAHHDVPWREPELVRDGADRPWSERGFVARAWARLRPRAPLPRMPHAVPSPADSNPECHASMFTVEKAR